MRRRPWLQCVLLGSVIAFGAQPRTMSAGENGRKEEQTSALRALDAAITRYGALVARIEDPQVAATARAFLTNYRERRDALHRNYDATKHDELRFDINVESHRLAQWLAPLRTPPSSTKPGPPQKNSENPAATSLPRVERKPGGKS